MANTTALQEAFEWARAELGSEYGVEFAKRAVSLLPGGKRTFNAVALDRSVVATVMNSSGPTSGGKKPVGKIRAAIAELYNLSIVDSPIRLVVVVDPAFHELLERELKGALDERLTLRLMALPPDLRERVSKVTSAASDEMTL